MILTVETPLGLSVTLDEETLSRKAAKHGPAWANVEQCKSVFEDPELITTSQNPGQETSLMFFRKADITTPTVKYVRGIADFSKGEPGIITSIHPRKKIGPTGEELYPLDEEMTDGDG